MLQPGAQLCPQVGLDQPDKLQPGQGVKVPVCPRDVRTVVQIVDHVVTQGELHVGHVEPQVLHSRRGFVEIAQNAELGR